MKQRISRFLALVLSVISLVGLVAGCGSNDAGNTTAATESTPAPTEETRRQVTVVGDKLVHMSYNLAGSNGSERHPNFADNLYKQRNFKKLIEDVDPDTFGIQESPQAWREGLVGLLDGKYGLAGSNHPDIEGDEKIWINAIFYKVDKFTCLEEGVLFLSEGFGKAGSSNRSISFAYLERIEDGERILIMSTHLSSASLGGQSLREYNMSNYGIDNADANPLRDKQVALISKAISMKLAEYAKSYDKEISVIVCGDFNINAWSDNKYSHEYTRLRQTMAATVQSPGIEDSAVVCANLVPNQTRKQWQTFRDLGVADPYHRLDYIFVSSNLSVDTHAVYVHNEATGESSDHFPVYTEYYIGH